jgi:glycerol dehydrogenase-like iron-containing ADH family enzyme
MNSNVLIIGAGKINEVKSTLEEASISGKILYVSDPYVDTIYGGIIRPQLEAVGQIIEQKVENNTIAYAMDIAECVMSRTAVDALLKTQFDHICPDFLDVLANCLVMSGIAMEYAGSSRPVSGSEHLFSHALDYFGRKQNLHGLNVALGTVAGLKIIGEDPAVIVDFLKKFEVDINPQRMEIPEDTFIYCMQHATEMRNDRYTFLHEADLSEKKLRKIYRELVEEL